MGGLENGLGFDEIGYPIVSYTKEHRRKYCSCSRTSPILVWALMVIGLKKVQWMNGTHPLLFFVPH